MQCPKNLPELKLIDVATISKIITKLGLGVWEFWEKWLKSRVKHQLTSQTTKRIEILLKKYSYFIYLQHSHDK